MISELIERLEKATGPDRWLDSRIDAALRVGTVKMHKGGYEWAWENFPVWAHHKQARGMCGVQHSNGDLGLIWDSLAFTDSIDAALALAERCFPGVWYLVGKGKTRSDEPLYGAALMFGDKPIGQGESDGSPAIALCIAILKAKQAQEVAA